MVFLLLRKDLWFAGLEGVSQNVSQVKQVFEKKQTTFVFTYPALLQLLDLFTFCSKPLITQQKHHYIYHTGY